MERIKRIYIDLDGVLADFDKGVRVLCGMEPRYQNGKVNNQNADKWWAKVAAVDHFYAKLDPIPGAKEMFDALYSKYGDTIEILSAVPRPHRGVKHTAEDKKEWVRRFISNDVHLNIVFRDEKKDYCLGENSILIDDLEMNIEEWEANGGTGVLFNKPDEIIERIARIEATLPLKIEINNKRDPGDTCYFSFHSVKVENNKYTAFTDKLKWLDNGVYVYDLDVQCFLHRFLNEFFDPNLKFNIERQDVAAGLDKNEFDWYGESFYTYDGMRNICSKLLKIADLLENNYDNPELEGIKSDFELWRMVPEDDPDYNLKGNPADAIERHKDVVIDFYRRFVNQISNMMEQHSNTSIIGVFGI